MLKTKKTNIVNKNNKVITLKGVNLGGWLMMEAYILGSPNLAEKLFRKRLEKINGKRALAEFDKSFRDNFIKERDVARIKSLGFNCIRVPFHYRLIEESPYKYSGKGLRYLDKVISWAEKYKIFVILDLHAACGSQNHDWHSDSLGSADLWSKKVCQHRTFALWEFVADRYKDKEIVAGYDILNEAVINDTRKLNKFYKGIIKSIRSVDRKHILFVEGNHWAQDIECLDDFCDDNISLSIHSYVPLEFTFNFIPHIKYPITSSKGVYDKGSIRKLLSKYKRASEKRGMPIFVGEFGVNTREGLWGEDVWLKDTLAIFKEFGFHWTYWTFKAIKGSAFPDGIYSYKDNPAWVHREGPLMGWDTYPELWKKNKKDMAASWNTGNFTENRSISKVLKNAAR